MRKLLRSLAEKIAPTAYGRLKQLSVLDDDATTSEILLGYQEQVKDLQAQLDEVRREHRHVVELYDLMFERLQNEAPLRERV
ncbi:hypothetical protein [Microbacterium terrisoli]|jgi:hypothetical protein|uniref:hypothetical protein n=1 Tax=Microbacterium terrisoli TaxID=3242192 RepID=UPI002805142B|nr:hypothetical protein [Microbacterium protaetiae]